MCGIKSLNIWWGGKMPKRIQRKRTKGFKLPPNTVCVDRTSRWGNPFVVVKDGDAAECVRKYRDMLMPYTHQSKDGMMDFYVAIANMEDIQISLRGKNLACFCPLDQPCHADVLLEIANMKD